MNPLFVQLLTTAIRFEYVEGVHTSSGSFFFRLYCVVASFLLFLDAFLFVGSFRLLCTGSGSGSPNRCAFAGSLRNSTSSVRNFEESSTIIK